MRILVTLTDSHPTRPARLDGPVELCPVLSRRTGEPSPETGLRSRSGAGLDANGERRGGGSAVASGVCGATWVGAAVKKSTQPVWAGSYGLHIRGCVVIDTSLAPEEHPQYEGRCRVTVAHEIGHASSRRAFCRQENGRQRARRDSCPLPGGSEKSSVRERRVLPSKGLGRHHPHIVSGPGRETHGARALPGRGPAAPIAARDIALVRDHPWRGLRQGGPAEVAHLARPSDRIRTPAVDGWGGDEGRQEGRARAMQKRRMWSAGGTGPGGVRAQGWVQAGAHRCSRRC